VHPITGKGTSTDLRIADRWRLHAAGIVHDRISPLHQFAAARRAAPRPPVPIPATAWARAYGLVRDPGSGQHAISLIGPAPDFSPEYAMTTNPGEPVVLATLTGPGGEPAGPLLIDGCHRLYKAAVTGRAEIPALVLTAAETLLIRSHAVLGPPRRAQPPRTAPRPHRPDGGDPRC
jgi:hypothetical protein